MKTNDYRNTEYCEPLENVLKKKKELGERIQKQHPKVRIQYNKICCRDTEYNDSFRKIYNFKCAYCGVTMEILPATMFEVDHFIAESLFENKAEAGNVENLVLSCYKCNRNKKAFPIVGAYVDRLNPDNGKITEVFYRDNQYYIQIKEAYIEDEMITSFYDKLQFNHQIRRLDYLLLNMIELYKKIQGTSQGKILAECILLLQKKRNMIS